MDCEFRLDFKIFKENVIDEEDASFVSQKSRHKQNQKKTNELH